MPRFFIEPSQIDGKEIKITGADFNHMKNALRMKKGEELTVSDGSGMDYFCVVSSYEQQEAVLDIVDVWPAASELDTKLYLFQGLPKGDKMELIIQKAVELGVYEIVPVVTGRTIVKLDPKKEAKKLARWQAIAESGAKQSGRAVVPQIRKPMGFKEALACSQELEAVVIPYEKAAGMEASRQLIREMKGKASIGIFIGPEGGFEEREIEAAMAAGVQTMTLGHRILRTETAGMTVLSLLMFELDKDGDGGTAGGNLPG